MGYVHLYYKGHKHAYTVNIFTVKLTGMLLTSTATLHNARLSHNGSIITCSDSTDKGSSVKGLV